MLMQQKPSLQCASKTKKCSLSRPTLKERDQDRTYSRPRPRGQGRDQDQERTKSVSRLRPVSRPTSLLSNRYIDKLVCVCSTLLSFSDSIDDHDQIIVDM